MRTGDGDGWVTLADGSRRWGLHGASGLLLHAFDEAGTGHVLLQHRAWWTHQGNTWGLPGGARNSGESSVAAALREFSEEVAGELGSITLAGIHRQDHQVWAFDTVLANLPERRAFSPGNSESESIRWVPLRKVPSMALIPAFGRTWPEIERALSERLLLVVDAATGWRLPDSPLGGRPGAAERLRDELAELARVGLAGAAFPPELALTPLHHRFPSVLVVVDARDRAPAPAPGVEVAPAPGADADTIAGLVGARSARARTVVVTDDPVLRSRAATVGAHPLPSAWLLRALQDTGAGVG